MKITVFKTDTRLSVKFEAGLLEQTYKFNRQNGLDGLKEVQQIIDEEFSNEVESQFQHLERYRSAALTKHFPEPLSDEFDEII